MNVLWHHVAIACKSMTVMRDFYTDVLNFNIEWEFEHYSGEHFSNVVGMSNADAHVVMLSGHNGRIELFQYHRPRGETAKHIRQCDFRITHFALAVTDIHQHYQKLAQKGVPFNCPPQELRPGVWATYLKDPERNTIELIEYLDSSG